MFCKKLGSFGFILTFKTIVVHNMYFSCNLMNSLLSYFGLTDFKNESYQHRFTCNQKYFSIGIMSSKVLGQNRLRALKASNTFFPAPETSESKGMSTELAIVRFYLSF